MVVIILIRVDTHNSSFPLFCSPVSLYQLLRVRLALFFPSYRRRRRRKKKQKSPRRCCRPDFSFFATLLFTSEEFVWIRTRPRLKCRVTCTTHIHRDDESHSQAFHSFTQTPLPPMSIYFSKINQSYFIFLKGKKKQIIFSNRSDRCCHVLC